MSTLVPLPGCMLLLALFGCASNDGETDGEDKEGDETNEQSSSDLGAAAEDGSDCVGEFDTYEPGMSKRASPGQLDVELKESKPAPPAVHNNDWWLHITHPDGEPVEGAKLTVTPFMPEHQHGSPQVVAEEAGEGEYELSPVDLIMPGLWEIPVVVTPPQGEASRATFRFCIAAR